MSARNGQQQQRRREKNMIATNDMTSNVKIALTEKDCMSRKEMAKEHTLNQITNLLWKIDAWTRKKSNNNKADHHTFTTKQTDSWTKAKITLGNETIVCSVRLLLALSSSQWYMVDSTSFVFLVLLFFCFWWGRFSFRNTARRGIFERCTRTQMHNVLGCSHWQTERKIYFVEFRQLQCVRLWFFKFR